MTLIKLMDSLNVQRVCGILTRNSQEYIEGTTIGALAMLSYCNELEVSSMADKLQIVDISLNRGGVSYSTIVEASGGALILPRNLKDEKFCVVTNPIRFKLVIGRTTYEDTLTSSDVHTYVSKHGGDGFSLTEIPLPLLTNNLVTFETTREGTESTIKSDNVDVTLLHELGAIFSNAK